MKFKYTLLSVLIICLPACTWVEATRDSEQVTLVKDFNVKSCNKLGTTKAKVQQKIGLIVRDEDKVTAELIVVAKNRAAEMGADSIVAVEPAFDGVMMFDVYRCDE